MPYLTGPVNTLGDFQLEFNGLLMGAGTYYGVPEWSFLDLPPVRTDDTARPSADGAWSGPDFADILAQSMDVEVWAPTAALFDTAAAALEASFTISPVGLPLWYKLPARPVRGIPMRVTNRRIPIDTAWGRLSKATVQWRATETRGGWQSQPRPQAVTGSSSSAHGGLIFPMFTRVGGPNGTADFGAAGPGSGLTLRNAGNSPAWPVVVVTGPVTGFTLVLDGHTVTYADQIGSGQQVTVDYWDGTATLEPAGAATRGPDRTPMLTARDWTPVPANGASSLAIIAPGGTAVAISADMWR